MMLDVDQAEISRQSGQLKYHMKFRMWFKELTVDNGKPSHYNLDRIYYTTEQRAGEYDIPPAFARKDLAIPGYPNWPLDKPTPGTTCTGTCPDGPDCECIHTITYRWTVNNIRLLYAGGHCHAPACLNLTLYDNTSGVLKPLCVQKPVYGKGNVTTDKFDEAGYIAIPPCLWSDHGEQQGLQVAPWLPEGSKLVSIKHNVNTRTGHFGEMASWQMRGVSFPAPAASMVV